MRTDAVEAYPDEPLRVVVYRMAEKGCSRMPVLERATRQFLGLVSLNDLLKARSRHLEEEQPPRTNAQVQIVPSLLAAICREFTFTPLNLLRKPG